MSIYDSHVGFILDNFGEDAADCGRLLKVVSRREALSTVEAPDGSAVDVVTVRAGRSFRTSCFRQDGSDYVIPKRALGRS